MCVGFNTVMKYTHYFQEASTPCCIHTNILLMILPNRQRNKKNSYDIDVEISMVYGIDVELCWRGSAPWFLRKKLVAVWRPMAGGSRLSGCGARAGRKHISLSPQQPDCWSWRVETVGRHGHCHHRQEGLKHETGMFGPWSGPSTRVTIVSPDAV